MDAFTTEVGKKVSTKGRQKFNDMGLKALEILPLFLGMF